MTNLHEKQNATQPSVTPCQSYSTDRAAEILDTSGRQIRRLIASGQLRAFRLGKNFRVTADAIAELQSRNALGLGKAA